MVKHLDKTLDLKVLLLIRSIIAFHQRNGATLMVLNGHSSFGEQI